MDLRTFNGSWLWWHIPLIPTLKRQKEAALLISRLTWSKKVPVYLGYIKILYLKKIKRKEKGKRNLVDVRTAQLLLMFR